MKFLQFLGLSFLYGNLLALSIGVVLADLHNFCACGKRYGKTSVTDAYVSRPVHNSGSQRNVLTIEQWLFDKDVTTYACTRYRNRQTGNKQWDQCPDCKMDTYKMDGHVGTPSCFSWKFHMGGDEFDYYCGLMGWQGYCKSTK
ncbi:hypothetical protein LY76DRAFT_629751 [Colletotrichum caudatum]|nr:hypothetical protein LY76DRAFT_629751 [Colletotrichum caudatum]